MYEKELERLRKRKVVNEKYERIARARRRKQQLEDEKVSYFVGSGMCMWRVRVMLVIA